MNTLRKTLVLSFFLFITISLPAFAQEIPLLVPIPGGASTTPTPIEYLRSIFLYGIGLATLLALAQLTFGAVQYTASAGFPALQETAKSRMQSAVVGLLLLIGAITILTMFYRPGQRDFEDLPSNTIDSRYRGDAQIIFKNQDAQLTANQETLRRFLEETPSWNEREKAYRTDQIADLLSRVRNSEQMEEEDRETIQSDFEYLRATVRNPDLNQVVRSGNSLILKNAVAELWQTLRTFEGSGGTWYFAEITEGLPNEYLPVGYERNKTYFVH